MDHWDQETLGLQHTAPSFLSEVGPRHLLWEWWPGWLCTALLASFPASPSQPRAFTSQIKSQPFIFAPVSPGLQLRCTLALFLQPDEGRVSAGADGPVLSLVGETSAQGSRGLAQQGQRCTGQCGWVGVTVKETGQVGGTWRPVVGSDLPRGLQDKAGPCWFVLLGELGEMNKDVWKGAVGRRLRVWAS